LNPHPLFAQNVVVIFPGRDIRLVSLYPDQTNKLFSDERRQNLDETVIEELLDDSFREMARIHR